MHIILKEIRESRGVTLHELAEKSGISTVQLWRIERGDSDPTFTTMCKIAHALKVPYYEIFIGEVQNE
jgi:transcriptional regulator with XRE-family HTH domain